MKEKEEINNCIRDVIIQLNPQNSQKSKIIRKNANYSEIVSIFAPYSFFNSNDL